MYVANTPQDVAPYFNTRLHIVRVINAPGEFSLRSLFDTSHLERRSV